MDRTRKRRVRAAAVVLAVTAGLLGIVVPTSAHVVEDKVVRRTYDPNCLYTGSSGHVEAITEKIYGSCDGHAWVMVRYRNGDLTGWFHRPGKMILNVGFSGQIKYSYHKGCRQCPVKRIKHAY